MTDKELVVSSATNVMGWKAMERRGSGLCFGGTVDFERPTASMIQYWGGCLGANDGNGHSWNPLASLEDAFDLVNALSGKGFSFAIFETPKHSSFLNGPLAIFRRSVHPPERQLDDEFTFRGHVPAINNAAARCRAIVLAALCAVGAINQQ